LIFNIGLAYAKDGSSKEGSRQPKALKSAKANAKPAAAKPASAPSNDFANFDPRQMSLFIFDLDGTLFHNLGAYRLRLMPDPGVPGLGMISGLSLEVEVPVQDYEGASGLRIRDLLGHFANNRFVMSAAIDEITLSNGQTIRPGYYYLDPVDSYVEFRSHQPFLSQRVAEKLQTKTPFLLESAAFLAATFAEQFSTHLRGIISTRRGHSAEETQTVIHQLRDAMKWGGVDWPIEAFVNFSNPQFFRFGGQKNRLNQDASDELANRMMRNFSTPHFLVVFENDRKLIDGFEKHMANIANRGAFANPVVPVLVNMVEPDVFENANGIDWDRSALESYRPTARVTVYWPGRVPERTNNLARVFELTLGKSPEAALALYNSYVNSFWCRNLLEAAK
jgi:hypothetical protein